MNAVTKFIRDEHGQDMAEYALVAGIIMLATVAVITAAGTSITGIWTAISTTLAGVPGA